MPSANQQKANAMKPPPLRLPKVTILDSLADETGILAEHVREKASPDRVLSILEAGCGASWELDLAGVSYTLTGMDVDEAGLTLRKTEKGDLDEAIVGDLRTVSLEENRFDVIYNSFVLEHVDGAQRVLDNFARWLKPGGILLLRTPDRYSVYGFLSRVTPFWIHVAYKRYGEGNKNAGKPGFDPFPTVYDKIVCREGIHRWCAEQGLTIKAEYGLNDFLDAIGPFALPAKIVSRALQALSFGRLTADYANLTYVIEKPPAVAAVDQPQTAEPCTADA